MPASRATTASTPRPRSTAISSGVVDPTKVTRIALQNAASVGGLLLTTDVAVAEQVKERRWRRQPRRRGRDGHQVGHDQEEPPVPSRYPPSWKSDVRRPRDAGPFLSSLFFLALEGEEVGAVVHATCQPGSGRRTPRDLVVRGLRLAPAPRDGLLADAASVDGGCHARHPAGARVRSPNPQVARHSSRSTAGRLNVTAPPNHIHIDTVSSGSRSTMRS